MRRRSELRKAQRQGLAWVKRLKKCGLFLDMGLGKTATALTAANDFYDDFAINHCLVIAPLRVANTVWKQEAAIWQHLHDMPIEIATGSPKQRLSALQTNAVIHVINRENIPWLVENVKWKWDMVIVDESSSFKNGRSKRFRAMRKILKHVNYFIALTGTPNPNGYMDLWAQIYMMDNGERLGRTITQYRNRYFTQAGYMGYEYHLRSGAAEEIKKKIKDICLSMKAEDYIDLPPKINITRTIELPNNVMSDYRQFEEDFILALKNKDIEALSASTLANKLLQLCNGAVYDEDGNTHEVHNLKLETLKDIIDDNPNENILVAYNYKSDLERLKKAFPKAKMISKKGEEIEAWNNGKIRLLLAHPASAGHGLNIQKGGAIIVWYGLNWSLELYQQFNARLHRQGQEKRVRVIHLVASGCIDEKVMGALNSKAETQADLLKFLEASYSGKRNKALRLA